jgi:hypothetical protein
MPDEWRAELKPRAGSAAEALIDAFSNHPVMSVHEIDAATAATSTSQAYRVIDQLVASGFLEEITGRKRDRVWAAAEVIAELDDLDRRIQNAMSERKRRLRMGAAFRLDRSAPSLNDRWAHDPHRRSPSLGGGVSRCRRLASEP